MTTTVVIPATMSYDGTQHTYTDDSDPLTGLDGGGHVDRMVPLVKDIVSSVAYLETVGGGVQQDVLDAQLAAANAASSELSAQSASSATSVLLTNAGSMLGINFGSFTVVDGELIVTHLTTSVPSIVNGDLVITYETL
jgi:hypothetical protein